MGEKVGRQIAHLHLTRPWGAQNAHPAQRQTAAIPPGLLAIRQQTHYIRVD